MNFAKPRPHIVGHQLRRLRHRDLSRFIAPVIGAEMIAAQNQTGKRKADPGGDGLNKIAKACRRHAGVTAKLINLIGGGFNQDLALAMQIKT